MTVWRWVRWRWWELRTGMGNYLSPVATAINTILLVQLYLQSKGLLLPLLILSAFISVGTTMGYLHRRLQQDTDARLANKALIEDIVKGVLEGLHK